MAKIRCAKIYNMKIPHTKISRSTIVHNILSICPRNHDVCMYLYLSTCVLCLCVQVWNHPWVLKLDQQRKERQELRKRLFAEDSDNSFIVPDSVSSEGEETTSTTSTSATKDFSRSSSITSDGKDGGRGEQL